MSQGICTSQSTALQLPRISHLPSNLNLGRLAYTSFRRLHVNCGLIHSGISHYCLTSMLVFKFSSRRAVISIKTKTTSPIPSWQTIKSNELYSKRLTITRALQIRHHGDRYVEIQVQS